jgi:biotin transport system substrate-specific component
MKAITTTLERPIARTLGMTLVFAAITAAAAQISFRLPGNPVPITLQVLGVVLSGLLLGSKRGALAMIQYAAAGIAGAPVFAGWTGGPAALLGPSGGYIPGFILGAFLAGWIFEHARNQDVRHAIIAGSAGVAGIYLLGVPWLAIWFTFCHSPQPWLQAWTLGACPFIGPDAAKVVFASMVATGKVRWKR